MKRTICDQICLIAPTGKTMVPIQIDYDDAEDAAYPESEITLTYNGIQYRGKGTDYIWVDTFADLQHQLPEGMQLACCMTCRHGNTCPYGDETNIIFCTKDLKISSKRDMCEVFDRQDAFGKREVCAYGYCNDFVYQTEDYYTYSDYLYILRRNCE